MQSIVQQNESLSRQAAWLPRQRANADWNLEELCVHKSNLHQPPLSSFPSDPSRYREADQILARRTKLKYPAIMRTPPTGVEGPTILVKAPILSGETARQRSNECSVSGARKHGSSEHVVRGQFPDAPLAVEQQSKD